jgi:hypothetical protein
LSSLNSTFFGPPFTIYESGLAGAWPLASSHIYGLMMSASSYSCKNKLKTVVEKEI